MLPEVRMARITDAIGLHRSKKLSCVEAAEMLGMSAAGRLFAKRISRPRLGDPAGSSPSFISLGRLNLSRPSTVDLELGLPLP